MTGTVNAGSIIYEVDMDTAKLISARREVDAALNGMSGNMGRLETSVNRTERSVNSMERSMSSLTGIAKALFATLSVQQVTNYADAWTVMNNKLSNSVRAQESLFEVTERVFNITQLTRSSLDATATLYSRLERGTREYNTSAEDLVRLTTIINQGFVVSGATATEAENAIIQLSQGIASGVLRGEEFNSVSEQGSRLMIALADSLGVGIGQLRKMAGEGKLTTDVVVNGLLSQGNAIGKEFANTTITISQAMQTAGNNMTKFFGESSTIKAFTSAFNNSIVTVSENISGLSTVLMLVAGVMGGRFVGALTMATAAKVKDVAASAAQNKASLASAKSAEIEASNKVRVAQADKSAAISALNNAEGKLTLIKATNGQSIAEVRLVEAQIVSIKTQASQIQSEKALEVQRLNSQISEQGRIATATRMAQLQQASAVLNKQLATAEASTAQIKAAAIVAAEAEISAARIATANTTSAASAANANYTASQAATVVATRNASTALGLLKTGLGFIGGGAGLAMIAGAAIYYFWQQAKQAREEALAFADSLDKLKESMVSMNNTQLRGTIADTTTALEGQEDQASILRKEIASLTAEQNDYTERGKKYNTTAEQGNGLLQKAATIANDLAKKKRDLADVEQKINGTTKVQNEARRRLTNNMLQAMGITDNLTEKSSLLAGAQTLVAKAFNDSAASIEKVNQASQNFNPKSLKISPATADGDKLILSLEEQNKLLKIKDERTRAVTKAEMEMAKVSKNDNQITGAGKLAGENFDLQKAEEARTKAQRDSESQDKKSASSAESVAQKLANLKQQSDQTANSTRELSRAQAIQKAGDSLGKSAKPEDIKLAGEYAAKIWDTSNALRALSVAESLLPERQENTRYQQQAADLKNALESERITRAEYNTATEKAAQDHQNNLAKIRSEAVVNPVADNRGQIDPIQQLANENASKLQLMRDYQAQEQAILLQGYQSGQMTHDQFTAAKTATDAQYLALRTAQEKQFQEQQTAAQWQLLSQQGLGYDMLTSAVDAFSGNASNALTGLMTGSMSAQDAMRSLGNTILNSAVNSVVQLGVEMLKNFILSQTLGVATQAANAAAATAGGAAALAAWTPAAIAASIATAGAASGTGLAAYSSAQASGMALSVLGGRKNGGPVSGGGLYPVGEGNLPEFLQTSRGLFMIPGDNGRVFSNKDSTGAPTIPKASTGMERLQHSNAAKDSGSRNSQRDVNVVINVTNNTPAQAQFTQSYDQQSNTLTVEGFISDMREKGPMHRSITQNTTASTKLGG